MIAAHEPAEKLCTGPSVEAEHPIDTSLPQAATRRVQWSTYIGRVAGILPAHITPEQAMNLSSRRSLGRLCQTLPIAVALCSLFAASAYAQQPGFVRGDANLDGQVSADDYGSVQSHFGDTAGAGAASVPEPMTMTLLAIGGLQVLRRRWR